MTWHYVLVILTYGSLLFELAFLHVPSVASSANLLAVMEEYEDELREAKVRELDWPIYLKAVTLALPILLIVCTFLYPISCIVGWIDVPTRSWSEAGAVTMIAGALIAIGRFVTLRSVLTIRQQNKQVEDQFFLHREALYSRSRNPIQLGMYIFCFGLLLLFPSVVFMAGIVFYGLYMHYKILIEERFLQVKFGTPYINYINNTRRYF